MTENRDQDNEMIVEDDYPIVDPDLTEFLDEEIVNDDWDESQGIKDEKIIGCGSEILASRKLKKK